MTQNVNICLCFLWKIFHIKGEPLWCWICFRKHKNVFAFWIISRNEIGTVCWLISFLAEDRDLFIMHYEYHGVWWLAHTRSQGISNHGISRLSQNIPVSAHEGLTFWGRVAHICLSKLIIIDSDNGLYPGRHQCIVWTDAGILLFGPLEINFSEMCQSNLVKRHSVYCYVQYCIPSLIARFVGPTWGPTGPRWAPCWPHELCYLGCYDNIIRSALKSKRCPHCPQFMDTVQCLMFI